MTITLSPQDRQEYIDGLLALEGLTHVKEDQFAAYCPISLTQTPEEIKEFVLLRQNTLMTQVLANAGLTAYDPSTAPYSPDKNLTSLPQEVYLVDSSKIVGARFFVGHNLTASTGFGIELEKAVKFNRLVVILMDANIRVSRMQPHRAIYLQYHNFAQQASEFVPVFELLRSFDPGMGLEDNESVLLGRHRETGEVVNLEQLVYQRFPQLKYQYDGQKSTLNLSAVNPELFYEKNNQ